MWWKNFSDMSAPLTFTEFILPHDCYELWTNRSVHVITVSLYTIFITYICVWYWHCSNVCAVCVWCVLAFRIKETINSREWRKSGICESILFRALSGGLSKCQSCVPLSFVAHRRKPHGTLRMEPINKRTHVYSAHTQTMATSIFIWYRQPEQLKNCTKKMATTIYCRIQRQPACRWLRGTVYYFRFVWAHWQPKPIQNQYHLQTIQECGAYSLFEFIVSEHNGIIKRIDEIALRCIYYLLWVSLWRVCIAMKSDEKLKWKSRKFVEVIRHFSLIALRFPFTRNDFSERNIEIHFRPLLPHDHQMHNRDLSIRQENKRTEFSHSHVKVTGPLFSFYFWRWKVNHPWRRILHNFAYCWIESIKTTFECEECSSLFLLWF